MISNFRLKFGHAVGLPPEDIKTTPVTVFVGPNNSGKSKALLEIEQYCRTGQKNPLAVILDDLTFSGLSSEEAEKAIEHIKQSPNRNEIVPVGNIIVGSQYGRIQISMKNLLRLVQSPAEDLSAFCVWFLTHNTLILDGRRRIDLVNPQTAGDLQQPSNSSFQVLFQNDAGRKEVRRIVAEAFGLYFVVDPTNLGQLRIRLADRAPNNDIEERGIHEEAVLFHSNAQLIDFTGDGVKAFTGIITELVAGDPRIVLIDEPEAFLHPSLAFKLGYEVSLAALKANKRVFASTHSPTFVMGCLQSGAPVNIIRLTYRGKVATARLLPSGELLELMRHPLLRSTGVLSGLFYEFVIVTESDADRAFYQEINERLLHLKPEWGIPNCLFINAQNKQTVNTIIRPLRRLGIPAAGIVDVDILKEGGTSWTNLLSSASIPQLAHQGLSITRAAVKKAMDETGLEMKSDGGLEILKDQDKEAALNLFDQLSDYGIFVVPGGELESWLHNLGIKGHGPSWLISIFEKMGSDPNATDFLRPSEDDVWQFLSQVKSWLFDPNRKGIPV